MQLKNYKWEFQHLLYFRKAGEDSVQWNMICKTAWWFFFSTQRWVLGFMLDATMILSKDYKTIYIYALGEGFYSADTKKTQNIRLLSIRELWEVKSSCSPHLSCSSFTPMIRYIYSLLTKNYSILDDVVLILNRRWQQLPGCIQKMWPCSALPFPQTSLYRHSWEARYKYINLKDK